MRKESMIVNLAFFQKTYDVKKNYAFIFITSFSAYSVPVPSFKGGIPTVIKQGKLKRKISRGFKYNFIFHRHFGHFIIGSVLHAEVYYIRIRIVSIIRKSRQLIFNSYYCGCKIRRKSGNPCAVTTRSTGKKL